MPFSSVPRNLRSTCNHPSSDEIGHCRFRAASCRVRNQFVHSDDIQRMDRAAAIPLSHADSIGVTFPSLIIS